MKMHPVHVEVLYTSGRKETLTIKDGWPAQRATLEDAIRHGAVTLFTFRLSYERVPTTIGKSALS